MATELIYEERFNLEECVEWIESNGAKVVCLFFLPRFYCLASEIAVRLKKCCGQVNFLVMISGSSGVDTVKYRVKSDQSSPDAVIYFGTWCLCPANYSANLPILFVPLLKDENEFEYIRNLDQLKEHSPKRILLLSDLTNSSFLLKENVNLLSLPLNNCCIDRAKFLKPKANNFYFTKSTLDLFESTASESENYLYSPFIIPNDQLEQYDLVIFLGHCANLEFVLNSRKLVVIDPQNRCIQTFDGPKEFRKRISLVEKFKSQSVNLIGIVFVNFSQSVTPIMNSAKSLCKKVKKAPYFLTLNQTDFELRLGNFCQLEGFVFITSCDCNLDVAQKTSKYLYPVIFWKEFLIACAQRISYGGIEWNQDVDQIDESQEDQDKINDEENMKLVERDLFKRPDGWFGLVVDAGSTPAGHIKEGLRGIPSSYTNEEELF